MENEGPDVVLWPQEDQWADFVAACDDEVPETYAEFDQVFAERLDEMHREGIDPYLLKFDVAEMRAWCITQFGKVNAQTRAIFAGWLFLRDEGGG